MTTLARCLLLQKVRDGEAARVELLASGMTDAAIDELLNEMKEEI